jgi:hypothetical protein
MDVEDLVMRMTDEDMREMLDLLIVHMKESDLFEVLKESLSEDQKDEII